MSETIADADYDKAVKEIGQRAYDMRLSANELEAYATRMAEAYCKHEEICAHAMQTDILTYHATLKAHNHDKPRRAAVLFRKDPDGDLLALFPEWPGTHDALDIATYSQQHGWGDIDATTWDATTTPPTPEEASVLKQHLEQKGHQLHTIQNPTPQMGDRRIQRARLTTPNPHEAATTQSVLHVGIVALLLAGLSVAICRRCKK